MTTPNQPREPKTDAWPPQSSRKEASTDDVDQASEETKQPDLLTELLTSVYRAEGMAAQGFSMLRERVEALERRLFGDVEASKEQAPSESSESSAAPESAPPDAPAASDASTEQVVAEVVQQPPENGDVETFQEVPPAAQPTPTAQPLPQPVQPVRDVRPVNVAGGEMEGLIFGDDLAGHPSYSRARQSLLQALRQGDEDALGLAGEILIVRSATMDRLPTLLKDVGEAWYRWPGGSDELRDALIAWLHARLDAVGLGNRIELVRVGDRYDSKRHNAKARGVEVTGVHGWVVLRDNGNVYTKATVAVA